VITSQELEQTHSVRLIDSLKNLKGITIHESGRFGDSVDLRILGSGLSQSLILIDGVEVNSTSDGFFEFTNLFSENIERIEVIKGAQSALYGSEAMGGVINIISKKGEGPPSFRFMSEGGKLNTFRESIFLEGSKDKFAYSLSLNRVDQNGQFKRDDYKNSYLSGRLDYELPFQSSLTLNLRYDNSRKNLAFDTPISLYTPTPTPISKDRDLVQFVKDRNNSVDRWNSTNSLNYRLPVKNIGDFNLRAFWYEEHWIFRNFEDKNRPFPTNIYHEYRKASRYGFDINQTFNVIKEKGFIILGFEYKIEDSDSKGRTNLLPPVILPKGTFKFQEKKRNFATYLQNSLRLKDIINIDAGVRIDENSIFGTVVNPRASFALYMPWQGGKIKGAYGSSFRGPSISELRAPFLGNPDLGPEKAVTYQAGIEQTFFSSKFLIDASYFRINFSDLLVRTPKYMNISKARVEGIQIGIGLKPIKDLNLSTNYTWMDTEDEDNNRDLPWRPKYKWDWMINYLLWNKLNLNILGSAVGKHFEPSDVIGTDGRLRKGNMEDGYTTVDASAKYTVFENKKYIDKFEIFLKGYNIFNEDYEEVRGSPLPGITYLFGAEVYF